MGNHADVPEDVMRRLEEWLAESNGFSYCCETALENGLTYDLLRVLLAERQQLREALEDFANPQHWGVTRDGREPVPIWIGTYREHPTKLAADALAAVREPSQDRETPARCEKCGEHHSARSDTFTVTPTTGSAPQKCHCGLEIRPRGDDDPWEGRMDAYCTSCASARCDCYPDECPVVKYPAPAEPGEPPQ